MTTASLPHRLIQIARDGPDRPLEQYLSGIVYGLEQFEARPSLRPDDIAWLVERAFLDFPGIDGKIHRLAKRAARNDLDVVEALRRRETPPVNCSHVAEVLSQQVLEIREFLSCGIWRVLPFDGHTAVLDGWLNLDPASYVAAGVRGAMDWHDWDDDSEGELPWSWLLAFVRCGKIYE